MEGRTNGRPLSTGVVQCVEGKTEWKNSIQCQTYAQNRRPYRTQTLFQFSAAPSPIPGTTEYAILAHFMKKSIHLKTEFLSDYQVVFLLLNEPQIEKSL